MTLPANATELCATANDKACITGEFGFVVRELKKRPFRWNHGKRIPIAERNIQMTREEVVRAAFAIQKEKPMMTVTGEAKFVAEGEALEVEVRIQPMAPHEHALLEKIASREAGSEIRMEQGNLVLKAKLLVPQEGEDAPTPDNASSASEGEHGQQGSAQSDKGEQGEESKE